MDVGGVGVADDNIAQAGLAPGFHAEASLAACGHSFRQRSGIRLILQDEDGHLVFAHLKKQLSPRVVLEVD